MADWKEVLQNIWQPKENGSISGILKTKLDKDGKKKYIIDTGENDIVVFGAAVLDDLMTSVKEGAMVRVTFLGKKKLEGGKTLNLYKVETK